LARLPEIDAGLTPAIGVTPARCPSDILTTTAPAVEENTPKAAIIVTSEISRVARLRAPTLQPI
jgi:hypothetical protein